MCKGQQSTLGSSTKGKQKTTWMDNILQWTGYTLDMDKTLMYSEDTERGWLKARQSDNYTTTITAAAAEGKAMAAVTFTPPGKWPLKHCNKILFHCHATTLGNLLTHSVPVLGLSSCYCGFKVCSFMQWAAANCTAPTTASAGQYATSNCKLLLFWLPCKWQYINVSTFNL